MTVKGRPHYIECDIAGTLGLAWLVWDWELFSRWLKVWSA